MRFARGGNLDWLTDSGDSIVLRIFAFATTPDVSKLSSAEEINDAANATLHRFVEANPSAEELGRKAAGVLVFPSAVKAGMLLGGQYGEGVLIVRGNAAGYYNIISASLGFQLGVQSISRIAR